MGCEDELMGDFVSLRKGMSGTRLGGAGGCRSRFSRLVVETKRFDVFVEDVIEIESERKSSVRMRAQRGSAQCTL